MFLLQRALQPLRACLFCMPFQIPVWQPLKMKYVPLSKPYNGAFGYVEYSFESTAGTLVAGGNSGDLQSRLANQNWANLNEADDYSYQNSSSYAANDHITIYRNGVLVAGTE